jgi:dTDP-6-deoxy-L-talose 4-dehydrogenase (NAD+)
VNVLVSGANGFIGSHLCHELQARNHNVIGLTRQLESIPADHNKDIQWLESNIGDTEARIDITALHIDAIVHLAWPELDNYQSEHHVKTYPNQHLRWLKQCIDQGVQKVQVIGTCFEYGLQQGCLKESLASLPVTAYGEGKNQLRLELERLQLKTHYSLQWARLFYLYGDGQRPNSFVPQLKNAIDKKMPIFKMSAGDQVRDYLNVSVICQSLVRLLETDEQGIFNCSSNRPITVKALAQNIIEKANSTLQLGPGHYPYSPHEPMSFWGDNHKLLKALQIENIHDL